MEASPMSLFEKFIKEAYGSQYVIPVYQRNYTWRKNKQVKQLLVDIEQILKGETKRHFIGTVVYVIVNTDFIVRERAVVDGQQRLITMFLISYALKNIANEIGELNIANEIKSSYLENNNSNKYKFRLKPAVTDDNAYVFIAEDRIEEYEGQSLIMDNYKYLYENLKVLIDRYSLMRVINAIRELYIVRIELDENDNAQQIFESINSTGEKLTSADLIRNYIMMNKLNDEQEEIFKNYWLKLENIFKDSRKIAEFLRFYLASKKYLLTTERELYALFKTFWEEELKSSNYKDILKEILNYAKNYELLYFDASKSSLGEVLEDYRKLQSLMPAPFTMSILEYFRNEFITKQQTEEILKLINTYLIRRYINGQDTSAISRFFPGLLRNVERQIELEGSYKNIVDICIYFIVNENKGKAAFMPDDKQLLTYLKTANAYSLTNIRWILEKIETYKNPIPVGLDVLNIEHVMPQTSNEYWEKIVEGCDDEYVNIVNRFGNLTLVASLDNSKMGNKDFEVKKKVLEETSHLKLNEVILAKQNWTVDDIDQRTELLTKQIIDIFPYMKTSFTKSFKVQSRNISLNARGIVATGYLNEDNKLTVFANSQIKHNVLPASETLQELREDLLEKDIIELRGDKLFFSQNYTFSAPSSATDFILGGSNNGWNYWKDADGQIINDSLRNIN